MHPPCATCGFFRCVYTRRRDRSCRKNLAFHPPFGQASMDLARRCDAGPFDGFFPPDAHGRQRQSLCAGRRRIPLPFIRGRRPRESRGERYSRRPGRRPREIWGRRYSRRPGRRSREIWGRRYSRRPRRRPRESRGERYSRRPGRRSRESRGERYSRRPGRRPREIWGRRYSRRPRRRSRESRGERYSRRPGGYMPGRPDRLKEQEGVPT